MNRHSRLRPIGARKLREFPALVRFRLETLVNAGHRCERCGEPGRGRSGRALEAHHLVPRGRGVGWPQVHEAELNGAALCSTCHSLATLNPRDFCVGRCPNLGARVDRAFRAFDVWRLHEHPDGERVYPD